MSEIMFELFLAKLNICHSLVNLACSVEEESRFEIKTQVDSF